MNSGLIVKGFILKVSFCHQWKFLILQKGNNPINHMLSTLSFDGILKPKAQGKRDVYVILRKMLGLNDCVFLVLFFYLSSSAMQ